MLVTFHVAILLIYDICDYVKSNLAATKSRNLNPDKSDDQSSTCTTSQSRNNINDYLNNEPIIEINESSSDGPNPESLDFSVPSPCSPRPNEHENALENEVMTENDLNNIGDHIRMQIYGIKPEFHCVSNEDGSGMRFIPPVYTQRYMIIENILKEPCWASTVKKIVDFGCAELKFESAYLKKLEGIEDVISVDIDEDLLTYNSCRLMPSIPDYLTRRSSPLKVRIFCGSVANTNEVLVGCDAVLGIELIEHLFPHELEDLPFTVFGFIQPRIAIFTTPNSDFNVLFHNFSGFRHDDHKFEWSRQQFEDWGNNLALRYPDYSVSFQGVGPGPEGTDHLGCCSQMATFVKMYNSHSVSEDELHIQDGNYTLIKEYDFPFDERTREEKIRDGAISYINKQILLSRHYSENTITEIPFKQIMVASKCFNREKLKNILTENDWQIKMDESGYEVVVVPESEYDEESSNNSDEYWDQEQDIVEATEYSNEDENWDYDEKESKEGCVSDFGENWGNDRTESKVNSMNCSSLSSNNLEDSHIITNSGYDSLFVSNQNCLESEEKILTVLPDRDDYQTDVFSEKDSITDCIIANNSCDSLLVDSNQQCLESEEKMLTVLPDKDDYQTDVFSEKDLMTDCSIYETPYNDNLQINKSTNKLSSNQNCRCIKALLFETSQISNNDSNKTLLSTDEIDQTKLFSSVSNETLHSIENSENESLSNLNSVIFNNSTYATPCCSKLHNCCLPKCHSVQEINLDSSSLFSTEENSLLRTLDASLDQRSNINKSMESLVTKDICDMQETCSNVSKVLDSGYTDSCSEHDMELTFGQYDEMETNSEGNDSVSNFDNVNNNRDGEENNEVTNMEEDIPDFEPQIEEVQNHLINDVNDMCQLQNQEVIQCSSESNSLEERSFDMEEDRFEFKDLIEEVKSITETATKNIQDFCVNSKSLDEQSATTEMTNNDISKMETADKAASLEQLCLCCKNPNSLQERCTEASQFPVDDSTLQLNVASSNFLCHRDCCHSFPNWMKAIDCSLFECSTYERGYGNNVNMPHLNSLSDHHNISTPSVLESNSSLQTESNGGSFPTWLLDMLLSENEEYELESVSQVASDSDEDSVGDFPPLLPVHYDSRAGGDQNTWH